MELAKNEVDAVIQSSDGAGIQLLDDLQLALVGGGMGDTVL